MTRGSTPAFLMSANKAPIHHGPTRCMAASNAAGPPFTTDLRDAWAIATGIATFVRNWGFQTTVPSNCRTSSLSRLQSNLARSMCVDVAHDMSANDCLVVGVMNGRRTDVSDGGVVVD